MTHAGRAASLACLAFATAAGYKAEQADPAAFKKTL